MSEGNTWRSVVFVIYLYFLVIETFPWHFSVFPTFLCFLNQQPRSLLSTCVMHCRVDLCYHHLFLFITFLVVLVIQCQLQLSPSGPASTACWRLAQWVGGSCMRGTLWAACCGLCSPLNLCSVSLHSLHFSFFLPFFSEFLRWGKILRCGLFILVWCWFSHVLGRISYLHDSSLDCERLSCAHGCPSHCLH